ncbi:MAG: hypothetical protein HGA45_04760 [Chloroflexales bacterium]|nr:hypothetical protein [Chloroflexales bacterium]
MSLPSSLALLVPTKLAPPQPRSLWVERGRLLARLVPNAHTRLTVVIAPPGFGKSTLVAQWLSERMKDEGRRMKPGRAPDAGPSSFNPHPSSFAWLTLDEHDQHGLRFLAYVAGALERVYPQPLAHTLPLLTAQEPPPLYLALQALLVDLSALPSGITLILDDYHTVRSEEIHQAVAYLLRYLPPACHIVILSRVDPPLPLERLRAEQQLIELRANDLCFTPDETDALLTRLLGHAPSAALSASLQQETEGWAIALQLAALAHQEADASRPITGIAQRQVAPYLAEELFDRQPAPIQEALMALAVPEQFCAGLCAALLGAPDDLIRAEERINRLLHANLLVIPLDGEGRWHRFHRLFRDLLLRRQRLQMTPEAITVLGLRAARWLEAEGLFEEAVRHYLAAGAETSAAEVVERLLLPTLGRDQRALPPDAWLGLLPATLVARRPALLLLQARRATLTLDLDALAAHLRQLDALLADEDGQSDAPLWPGFAADRAVLWGSLHFWEGRAAEAAAALRAALTQGPSPWVAVQALILLGQALVALGRPDEALQLVDRFMMGGADPARAAAARFCRCGIQMQAGELDATAREARQLLDLASAADLDPIWRCYAEAFLAGAAYERGELSVAAAHYRTVVRHKDQANGATYMGSLVTLTLIAIATGDVELAAGYEQAAWSYVAEVGGRFLRHQAAGAATWVALARGDVAAALRAAERIEPDIHLGLSLWTATPRLSRVQALLAAGGAKALAEADAVLVACLAEVAPRHNMPLLTHCLALQACLRQAQGRIGEALDILEQAVQVALPRGLIWAFLDKGPGLKRLLQTLDAQGRETTTVRRLLTHAHTLAPKTPPLPAAPVPHLPELLTRREHEILAFLVERWSDKEIAAQLMIAPNTVRKHISTIFGKLGVRRRREAVAAARALGLLPKAS